MQTGGVIDALPLWALYVVTAVAAADKNPASVVGGHFVQSLNEVIDLHETRVTARRNRMPDSIWIAPYIVTILTMPRWNTSSD